MSGNTFKLALAHGELQIGLWLAMADSYAAQMLGGAGFDWLLIDGEHAPNTLPSILGQLQALAPYPTNAVVRAAWNDPVEIKRLLDIGVVNLLVPMVQDAKQAAMAVAATRYPPQGIRGVGAALARASEWNRNADYLASATEGMCVLVQAETRRALANLDDICQVDGVDGVFIGPADLAAEMGYLGKPGHPDVQQVIEQGIARIRSHGKAVGILTSDEPTAKRYIELGVTFTAVGADTTLLIRSAEALAARFGRGPRPSSQQAGAVY